MRSSAHWNILSRAGMALGILLPLTFAGLSVVANASTAPTVSLDIWQVDVTEKGTHCVVDPDKVRFWRADGTSPLRLRVYGAANAPSQIINFTAGEAAAWLDPATFPISDGSTMTISDLSSGATIGDIDFAIVSVPPDDPKALSEALQARNCTAQLKRLMNSSRQVDNQLHHTL